MIRVLELLHPPAVCRDMNGEILRVFGLLILLCDALLLFVFLTGRPRMGFRTVAELEFILALFLLGSGLLGIGLLLLHRWAAVVLSLGCATVALMTAANLGYAPWQFGMAGMPIVFGMLLPVYVTISKWQSLKPLEQLQIMAAVGSSSSQIENSSER